MTPAAAAIPQMSSPPALISRECDPAWTEAAALAEAGAICRRVTRARAANFYWGLRLTPEPKRTALYGIYAWSRLGDDIADGPWSATDRATRLAAFRADTARMLRGDISLLDRRAGEGGETIGEVERRAVWRVMRATVVRYPIDPAWLSAMLDGFEADLGGVLHQNEAELDRYCYRVASTVGMMCACVWGPRPGVEPQELLAPAATLGRAFQMTNVLRDFAEDLGCIPARVYLPADVLARSELTAQDLRSWANPPACRALVLRYVEQARRDYAAGDALVRLVDARCVPVLRTMTLIYRGVLEKIAADPQRVTRPNAARLGTGAKLRIAAGVAVGSWFRRQMSRTVRGPAGHGA